MNTSNNQTPPQVKLLNRRAFLVGLGVASLGMATQIAFPQSASAATQLIHLADDEWDTVDGALTYFVFNKEETTLTINDSHFEKKTYIPRLDEEHRSGIWCALKPGYLSAGNTTYTNIAEFLCKKSAIDAKTGKMLDVKINVDCTLHVTNAGYFNPTEPSPIVGINIEGLVFNSREAEGFGWPIYKCYIRVIDPDTGNVVTAPSQIRIEDIDAGNEDCQEQWKFYTVPTKAYVANDTLLNVTDNNTRFASNRPYTRYSDDTNREPEFRAVALFDTSSIDLEWVAQGAGSAAFTSYAGYPNVELSPIKKLVTRKIFT